MVFLYNAAAASADIYASLLASELPHLRFVSNPQSVDPAEVRYLVTWSVPADVTRYTKLELLFSTGAGADQFADVPLPPGARIVRMVDDGIARMIQEYVTLAVLALHRDLPQYLQQQARGEWRELPPRLAQERQIGVLGLGQLGQAVLESLKPFGFRLAGWSRSAHAIEGVKTYHGQDQLHEFLAGTDIAVCLLPLTPETTGFLDAAFFASLPPGASLVQLGRGRQLDQQALITALDRGHLSAAVIDVTDPEPLPADHPLWFHPRVILTPHIASVTQPRAAAKRIVDNIRRHESGLDPVGVIDRTRGY